MQSINDSITQKRLYMRRFTLYRKVSYSLILTVSLNHRSWLLTTLTPKVHTPILQIAFYITKQTMTAYIEKNLQ